MLTYNTLIATQVRSREKHILIYVLESVCLYNSKNISWIWVGFQPKPRSGASREKYTIL